jgi:uncharacterized membrane protein YdjX (TVP38/TMEM64 family)
LGRLRWLLGALALAAFMIVWAFVPIEEYLDTIAGWIAGMGPRGYVLFGLVYVLVTLTTGPAWMLSVSAGVAFGFRGVILVLPSAMAGALAGFFAARFLFREHVDRFVGERARLRAIDAAVEQHGFLVVLLLRLSPLLPFGAKSYLLGLSRTSMGAYAAGTAIGILPGSAAYIYLGSIGRTVIGEWPQEPVQWALLVAGIAATVLALFLIRRAALRKLREMGIA